MLRYELPSRRFIRLQANSSILAHDKFNGTIIFSIDIFGREYFNMAKNNSAYSSCFIVQKITRQACSSLGRSGNLGWTKAESSPALTGQNLYFFLPRCQWRRQQRRLHHSDWSGIFQGAAFCIAMLTSARCRHSCFSSNILGHYLHRLMQCWVDNSIRQKENMLQDQ